MNVRFHDGVEPSLVFVGRLVECRGFVQEVRARGAMIVLVRELTDKALNSEAGMVSIVERDDD